LRIGTVVALVALGIALLGISPASGGQQNTLNIEKVVVGDAPEGDFLIEVDCNNMVNPFAFASDGSTGTQTLLPQAGTTCVISEVDDLGAGEVTFACTVVANPQTQTFCDNDTTARFADTVDGEITLTVTNTFVEDVEPEAAEPAAEVVAATPAFTG
jgi:hypothetical protein